jgi:hypothetical protein
MSRHWNKLLTILVCEMTRSSLLHDRKSVVIMQGATPFSPMIAAIKEGEART